MAGGHRATSHGWRGARQSDEPASRRAGMPAGRRAELREGPPPAGWQAATERRAMDGEERGKAMKGPLSRLTGDGNWFEDFTPGQRMRHARGATVDEVGGGYL